jgi:23S rRNA (guanosine2251-2'-O)-methyltransferase
VAGSAHETGTTEVFGLHAATAVLARRPGDVRHAAVLAGHLNPKLERVVERLAALGIPVERAPRAALDARAGGGRHQGLILTVQRLMPMSLGEFEDLVVRRSRALRLLVLDQVEDPRNLGACLRTADAAGIDAVVVPKDRSASLTPAAAKAAAGAAETVPLVHVTNLARTLKWLQSAGVWVIGAAGDAPKSLYELTLSPPLAIVLGSEGQGLRRLTRDTCDELFAIPMAGAAESLNVSVAAGVVLFEWLRQSPPETMA